MNESHTSQNGTIIYTAILGNVKDELKEPCKQKSNITFFAFLNKTIEYNPCKTNWKFRKPYFEINHSRRQARAHKVLPHKIFPNCKYSLWVDGCLQLINENIYEIIEDSLNNVDICVFKHRRRNCIYDELSACLEQKKDDASLMINQVTKYSKEGYPKNNGLAETTAVLRRHNEITSEFNEMWWQEIENGSLRDQLSFDYVAWKLGIKYRVFEGTSQNNLIFKWFSH